MIVGEKGTKINFQSSIIFNIYIFCFPSIYTIFPNFFRSKNYFATNYRQKVSISASNNFCNKDGENSFGNKFEFGPFLNRLICFMKE